MKPLQAIKKYCKECGDGSLHEVKNCTYIDCPLYNFRFGKNPFLIRKPMSNKDKKIVSERLQKAREIK